MQIDPYKLVAFFHVVLFAYWLGADLGVFLCGRVSRSKGVSDEVRKAVRGISELIDMGPRTAAVLMVPVGITLSTQYGVPIGGGGLAVVWVVALLWLATVWTFYFRGNDPLGRMVWKIDMVIRATLMLAFLAAGASSLSADWPVSDRWLAAKFIVFGLILLDGIWLRLILLRMQKIASGQIAGSTPPRRVLMCAVLLIWVLVTIAAFLGVVKPF